MERTLSGQLTIPASEANEGGVYTDLIVKLYSVTGATETEVDDLTVPTTNTYSFTVEADEDQQFVIKLIRVSNGATLAYSVTRGVLPRSFRVPQSDSLYFTDFIHTNYSHDAGLAVAAVSGADWPSLANEIAHGIYLATVTGSTIPFKVNHVSTEGDAYYRSNSVAMVCYGLGYFIETNPTGTNVEEAALALYQNLTWLLNRRNEDGLIQAGLGAYTGSTLNPDFEDTYCSTIDNILAYFALKQAGLVLNGDYTDIAAELKTAINSNLWNLTTDMPYNGIYPTGINSGLNLETLCYAVFYLVDDEDIDRAKELLEYIDLNYKIIDQTNNITGYRATLTDSRVWWEGSFLVTLAYFKVGDTNTYTKLKRDLNKIVDPVDGSFKYGVIKNGQYEVLTFKSIGATAWANIVNQIPDEVFAFRSIGLVPDLPERWINQEHFEYFTKDCDEGQGTEVRYLVRAGKYLSAVSQQDADDAAILETDTYGQDYANENGECIIDEVEMFGNEEMVGLFTKSDCPGGQQGSIVPVTVAENMFTAPTQDEANQLASNYLFQIGPDTANEEGTCDVPKQEYKVFSQLIFADNGVEDEVYLKFYGSNSNDQPCSATITITYNYTLDGLAWVSGTTANILQGSNNTPTFLLDTVPSGTTANVDLTITDITPDESATQYFTWHNQVLESYGNEERSGVFQKQCSGGAVGSWHTLTVPANTYQGSTLQIANATADNYISLQGQNYANNHPDGTCTGTVAHGNELKQQTFQKQCISGTGSFHTYVVPANTYISYVSVNDANNMALADIATNGQNWVNSNPLGTCTPNVQISITLEPFWNQIGNNIVFKLQAWTDGVTNTAVTVYYNYTVQGQGYLGTPLTIPSGAIKSAVQLVGSFPNMSETDFTFAIYAVDPTSNNGKDYIF